MIISFLVALQLFTFVVNFALGVFIFAKKPHAAESRAFFLFSAGVIGWNLSLFLVISGLGDHLLWGRLAFSFGSLMAAGLMWFIHTFPQKTTHVRAVRNAAILLGVIFFLLPASSFMIRSVQVVEGHITGEFNPIPYLLWTVFFLATLLYCFVRSWINIRRSEGLARSQHVVISIGVTAFFIPFLCTNLLLPIFANDYRWNNLGPVFTIFLAIMIVHSILRYRFLEIRWVIKKSVDYIFLWAVSFGFVFGITHLLDPILPDAWSPLMVSLISAFAIALLVSLFFVPLSIFIHKVTSRVFNKGSYVFEDAVETMTAAVRQELELSALLRKIGKLLQRYLGFPKVYLVAWSVKQPGTLLEEFRYKYPTNMGTYATELSQQLRNQKVQLLEAHELEWLLKNGQAPKGSETVLEYMKSHDIALALPFTMRDECVGCAMFAVDREHEVLSERDIRFLKVIQGIIAPAIANAIRYAEMRGMYLELKELDKAKSDFIHVVSHAFRTPLNVILWNSELLEQRSAKINREQLMNEVRENAWYLNTTLGHVLTMLEYENGRLKFEKNQVRMDAVTKKVCASMQGIAEQHNVGLACDLAPVQIVADEAKLEGALRAIVENAVNYSNASQNVHLSLEVDEPRSVAHLKVKDAGIGISKKDLPHIFEKFFRGSKSLKVQTRGVGIGLYLAKELIEKQGGSIQVESAPKKGTEFTITFPLEKKKSTK